MFLFNDTLNTFYVRLYGVGHMVKDPSDRVEGERGERGGKGEGGRERHGRGRGSET